jgi:hypothetical protein
MEMENRLASLNINLVTIPRFGPILTAVILSENDDISCFPSPAKLIAFTVIDPSARQSGKFLGTRNHMSKEELPICTMRSGLLPLQSSAAELYQQKLAESKHAYIATDA